MSRLVIVDDDDELARMYALGLERAGFEVVTVADGARGLDVVRDVHPDLVLVDRRLPRMSGTDLVKSIRQDPATADLPVALLTNVSDDRDDQIARDLGLLGLLVKANTTPSQLVRLVHAWLDELVPHPSHT